MTRIHVSQLDRTADPLKWRSGPPPHVGWWNASTAQISTIWRYWDGANWSSGADQNSTKADRARALLYRMSRPERVQWRAYYPENARVPRVDPRPMYRALSDPDAALKRLRKQAAEVVALAEAKGYVATIDLEPVMPPRMGHYKMVVDIREARR